jgi:hypothetical protein
LNALYGAPAGPFETAASIDYANVLLLQALKQASAQGQVHALLEKRARKDVQAGMLALAASEGKDGYGWFGGSAPPDAALTAYALMMLRDAAKVVRMDAEIVERNQKFLLERRQKGALLDSSDPVAHAYVVWALTEAGIKDDLDAELAVLHQESKLRKDPYYLALAALSHLNRKKVQEGAEILRRLSALQNIDGELTGAKMGASGARGRDLDVETTALAILGWLKADRPGEFDANLKNAVKWLGQQRRGPGGYGGPQATVLALKAMLAHAQKHPRQFQGGEISLTQRGGAPPGVDIGPGRFSSPTSLTGRTQELITLTLDNAEGLAPGKNVIHLHTSAGNVLPYTLTWSYRTSVVPTGAKAPLKIAATLAPAQAMEGNTVKLRATIENQSGAEQGLSVAIIGLPAGLAIPEDGGQLDQLKKSGKISAWELQGRELVLYWGGLTAKAKNEVELDLHCRVPGFYRGPASRVYAFHDADRKYWLEPLSIRIGERK